MTNQPDIESLQQEISELKKEVSFYKQLVNEIAAPIIPSIVPNTILVPITGHVTEDRFSVITSSLLKACHGQDVETVIIDFTAISKKELDDMNLIGRAIDHLVYSLKLMGVEAFFVGFTPQLTQALMKSGKAIRSDMHTFLTFKSALQFLMKKKGISFA